MKKMALALIAFALIVAACGPAGTIVGKRIIPEHKETIDWCHTMPGTSVMTCEKVTRTIETQYVLVVKVCGSEKCENVDSFVSKDVYDSSKIGEEYQ